MSNGSLVTEFQLLGFSDTPELQILQFAMFLTLYLMALMGNFLIITVISLDHHLHTPMYFFLVNLSLVDFATISVIVPKAMSNSRSISYFACAAQVFFLISFMAMNISLLTIMAYDRYVAICDPLHYTTVMSGRSCVQMAVTAWISGLLYGTMHAASTFAITFCSNVIYQFFCEIPQLLKLSCSNLYLIEVTVLAFSTCLVFSCFIFITMSYVQIFRMVVKIPSTKGRKKVFSTCIPHLTVVSLFIFTCAFVYLRPVSRSMPELDRVVAVIYCTVPPIMNPVIYSIRNKDIQAALWKLINKGITQVFFFK